MPIGRPQPIYAAQISEHARHEMARRGIDEAAIRAVLGAPEQRHQVRPARDVLQSRIEFDGKTYLLRVFVDVDRAPARVVTAYRTSNIAKYWRDDP
ncbi:MAG: DUF4258 domain-containing protein [Rhodospirillaceae bacterium]|nr:DUF4258 domain-containing protein [Rhodospirillaceae bacterium]